MAVSSDLIGFSVFGFLDLCGSLRASPAICSERIEKSSWSESGEFEISSFDSSSSSAISIEILFRFSSARISSKVNSSSVFFLYTFVSDLISAVIGFLSIFDLVSVSTGFSSTSDLVSVSTGFSSDSILVSFDLSSVKLKSVFIVVFCAAIFSKSGLLSFFSPSGA